MSREKRPYIVPFVGLKNGKHNFDFQVGGKFFEEQGYDYIEEADVHFDVELEKKETMLIASFSISGSVKVPCARCTDSADYGLSDTYQWIYTFGSEESSDENLIVLPQEAYEIDFAPALYELTVVSVPSVVSHPEGECNEEMLEKVQQYVVNYDDEEMEEPTEDDEEEDERSPWDILKELDLKDNNKKS